MRCRFAFVIIAPIVVAASVPECNRYAEGANGSPKGHYGQSFHPQHNALVPLTLAHACYNGSNVVLPREESCEHLESEALLRDRGWLVMRGILPANEAQRLANWSAVKLGPDGNCNPQKKECALTSDAFRHLLPETTHNLERIFSGWEATGVTSDAELGGGLHVTLNQPRCARFVHVVSDATWQTRQERHLRAGGSGSGSGNSFKGGSGGGGGGDNADVRYEAGWHADNGGCSSPSCLRHRVWLLVQKHAAHQSAESQDGAGRLSKMNARQVSNVCLASTGVIDACDSPALRVDLHRHGIPPIWDRERGVAELYKRASCCPAFDVGDGVFYREDVVHRTQDTLVDRLGLIVSIDSDRTVSVETSPMNTVEDARCAQWAAAGMCYPDSLAQVASTLYHRDEADDGVSEYVRCTCKEACTAWSVEQNREL